MLKEVWRLYLEDMKDHPGREYGMDFPSLAYAQSAKATYIKWWGDRYYIRVVRVEP